VRFDLLLFLSSDPWGLIPQGDGTEAQVTWEDQQNINRFGRLNNRLHELDEEIKLAKVLCRHSPSLLSSFSLNCLLFHARGIYIHLSV
jgi:hypothetical protein